jgi:hypothetical protein
MTDMCKNDTISYVEAGSRSMEFHRDEDGDVAVFVEDVNANAGGICIDFSPVEWEKFKAMIAKI